ncbi:MAG: YHS domain-containing protein [Chloroflexota bacterium]
MSERQSQATEATEQKDPVCGMTVKPAEAAASVEYRGHVYYFCSAECAERFKADPEAYASRPQSEEKPSAAEGGVGYLDVGPAAKKPVPSVTTGVPEGAQVVRVELPVERLDCPECAKSVQQALTALPGVQRAFVSAKSGRATVVYDRARVGLPQMGEAVRQAGYLVGSAQERIGIEGMT